MIRVELDSVHRSALVYCPPGTRVDVRAEGVVGQHTSTHPWTYMWWGSEIGVAHKAAYEAVSLGSRLPATPGAAQEQELLETAALRIRNASLPAARIRWEYRDIGCEGGEEVRALVAVDCYLPDHDGVFDAPCPSEEEARAAHLQGANLRCNRCGGWGATWLAKERPGWGSLALCGPHSRDLAEEHARHVRELSPLRAVCFEQPARTG